MSLHSPDVLLQKTVEGDDAEGFPLLATLDHRATYGQSDSGWHSTLSFSFNPMSLL
ncbi:MAG TPA: hypothetical protein VK003_02215 [Oceanobacillus sp.]|nr:hypothetical protein [Oceanobacillus sp.]